MAGPAGSQAARPPKAAKAPAGDAKLHRYRVFFGGLWEVSMRRQKLGSNHFLSGECLKPEGCLAAGNAVFNTFLLNI